MRKYHIYNQSMRLASNQKGAVLIVSLMLMLAMTLLSIASMSTSVMQEKMAANAQNSNRTFQAAESAVEAQITSILGGDTQILHDVLPPASEYGTPITIDIGSSDSTAAVQIIYVGEMIADGNSLDADEGSNAIAGQRFELVGTGSMTAVGAQTQIRQGIEYHN